MFAIQIGYRIKGGESLKSLITITVATLLIMLAGFEASASILILETEHMAQPEHSEMVSEVACDQRAQSCDVQITDFNSEFLKELNGSLSSGDVVNMSFGYQRIDDSPISRNYYEALKAQGLTVGDYIDQYNEREKLFKKLFEDNPEVLFVAAAGNGMPLAFLGSSGVPLGPRYKIYPQVFEYENLINVTAINSDSFNLTDRVEYHIPDYANYSTDFVDVAAPIETDRDGTSFAAPYVTRLTDEIKEEISDQLLPQELKEIYNKSCYIQDLDYTLELIKDYKANPRTSIIGTVQNMHKTFMERTEIIKSIRPVMLVKCGGVLVSEVAKTCAKIYSEAQGAMSITDSCLYAQATHFSFIVEEEEKLKAYWSIQGL